MPRTDIASGGQLETVVASAARTANGDSGSLAGWHSAKTLRAQLDVTAVAGTSPSMTVLIEDTLDGTNWNTIGTFAARTAAGREVIDVTTPFSTTLRVSWAITGTGGPSFTFSVIVYSEN